MDPHEDNLHSPSPSPVAVIAIEAHSNEWYPHSHNATEETLTDENGVWQVSALPKIRDVTAHLHAADEIAPEANHLNAGSVTTPHVTVRVDTEADAGHVITPYMVDAVMRVVNDIGASPRG